LCCNYIILAITSSQDTSSVRADVVRLREEHAAEVRMLGEQIFTLTEGLKGWK
jgi:hypothetical protein